MDTAHRDFGSVNVGVNRSSKTPTILSEAQDTHWSVCGERTGIKNRPTLRYPPMRTACPASPHPTCQADRTWPKPSATPQPLDPPAPPHALMTLRLCGCLSTQALLVTLLPSRSKTKAICAAGEPEMRLPAVQRRLGRTATARSARCGKAQPLRRSRLPNVRRATNNSGFRRKVLSLSSLLLAGTSALMSKGVS